MSCLRLLESRHWSLLSKYSGYNLFRAACFNHRSIWFSKPIFSVECSFNKTKHKLHKGSICCAEKKTEQATGWQVAQCTLLQPHTFNMGLICLSQNQFLRFEADWRSETHLLFCTWRLCSIVYEEQFYKLNGGWLQLGNLMCPPPPKKEIKSERDGYELLWKLGAWQVWLSRDDRMRRRRHKPSLYTQLIKQTASVQEILLPSALLHAGEWKVEVGDGGRK